MRTLLGALTILSVFLLCSRAKPGKVILQNPDSQHPLEFNNKVSLDAPYGFSYSPLTEDGKCKSASQIISDISQINASTGVLSIRLYSTDCGVLRALDASKTSLQVILGIQPYEQQEELDEMEEEDRRIARNLSNSRSPLASRFLSSIDEQLDEIAAWNRWDLLHIVVVGSQGVFDSSYSKSELVYMVNYVKIQLRRLYLENHHDINEFGTMVTVAEPVQSYISSAKFNAQSGENYRMFRKSRDQEEDLYSEDLDDDLCAAVDVVGLVSQPYFNSAIEPHLAGAAVARDVRFAQYLCSDQFIGTAFKPKSKLDDFDDSDDLISAGEPIVILETGWPSAGNANSEAVAGHQEQTAALQSLLHCGVPVVLYSYQNELWRDPGDFAVETNFGCGHLFTN